MQALISDFVSDLKSSRPESSTPSTYKWSVERLAEFLSARDLSLEQVDSEQISQFVSWITTRRRQDGHALSASAVKVAVRGSRAFLEWAMRRGFIPRRPLVIPPLPQVASVPARSLSDAELTRYRDCVGRVKDPVRGLLELLPLISGAKIKELCSAPLAGVGRSGGATVLHVRAAGAKSAPVDVASMTFEDCTQYLSPVVLPQEALLIMRDYLIRARPQGPWLFPGTYSHVSAQAVRMTVRTLRVELDAPWLTPKGTRKAHHESEK